MSTILKASLPCSGSPAVAVALGYSKLCQNLALGAWSRLYLLQNLGLLICGHMLARPSSSVGIDVFSNGEDQETARPPDSSGPRFLASEQWSPGGWHRGRVPTQTLLACLHELFGPRVEVIGFDAFAPAQFVDCDLATKAPPGLYGSSLLRCISCEWLTNLPNEPSGVLAPFFSRLILVLDVLDHVRSFPEA